MRRCSENTWFAGLAPADAARIVVLCERLCLGEWLRLERMPTGRMAIKRDDVTLPPFEFGRPGEDLLTAVRALHRRMSPLIVRRVKREHVFGKLLLLEAVRAWLNDDVDLAKGLMRRLVDASLGYEYLAATIEGHPKSLMRMLSPQGNPSAKHLTVILTHLASHHGASFKVELK